MTIWKAIAGYEGYYEVSNEGEVRSIERTIEYVRNGKIVRQRIRERILKQGDLFTGNENSYKVVNLAKEGENKMFLVHRLVAMAFVPNPDNLPEVNHKHEDGCKFRNHADNLEWTTHAGNAEHSCHVLGKLPDICKRTLTQEQIEYIRNSNETRKALAEKFGVHVRTIFRIREL